VLTAQIGVICSLRHRLLNGHLEVRWLA